MSTLLNARTQIGEDMDGLYREYTQLIPTEFLDALKREHADKAHQRAGEYDRACSIPTAVVELWLRQGFDAYKESARACVKRLRDHGLDHFVTTPRRV